MIDISCSHVYVILSSFQPVCHITVIVVTIIMRISFTFLMVHFFAFLFQNLPDKFPKSDDPPLLTGEKVQGVGEALGNKANGSLA